jgi:tetratricopeptide (TPR) repeat protein
MSHWFSCLLVSASAVCGWGADFGRTLKIENQPWSAAFREGESALGRADYDRAISSFEQVRNSIQPLDPNDEIAAGFAANNLGSIYANLGRYVEAEPAFHQALSIFERVLGAGHPDTGVALNNLASFYSKTGRDPEATPLLRRALEIHLAALGGSDPQVANDLNNLGAALLNQRKFAAAEPFFRRAIEIGGAARPPLPRLPDFLANLGAMDLSLHRFVEAEQLLRRALDLRLEAAGSDSPGAIVALGHLAELAILRYDYARSRTLYAQMLPMAVRVFGPNHPRTADAVFGLAVTNHREGQLEQSEQLFLHLIEIDAAGSVVLHNRAAHLAAYATLLRQMHRSQEAKRQEQLSRSLGRQDPLQAFLENTVDAADLARR